MSNPDFDTINALLNEARESLAASQQIMDDILHESAADETSSFEEIAISIQLTLQYRLNCQNALALLLSLDHHLLYILGIQPQHSATTNLERISYALGSDDLKQILHALCQLVDSLLRIARRHQANFSLKTQNQDRKPNPIIKGMQKLSLKHNQFLSLMHKLEDNIKQIVKLEAIGPIHDHIAALRGPISQFHQAILNGLAQAELLYQKINKNQTLNYRFDTLLKKAEQVLNIMPSLYQPSPNYSLGHFATTSSEQLEQRAAAKRLRPFF
ncbi:Uncharacterised protein [Legionella lansingensis]|uniref:Uncharacterized protein n=1 Tax=Legionella lansingensis TaxID=45067 RepID=A0A0W0VV29_9GAMM|nr:hypothetical protein [Legionella lansingensis]KTD23886.1 hypothetical protein Llan_0667 [Legionella lansingensis]SNV46483.1 Uncharacterised protein [Legionella lansingensis]